MKYTIESTVDYGSTPFCTQQIEHWIEDNETGQKYVYLTFENERFDGCYDRPIQHETVLKVVASYHNYNVPYYRFSDLLLVNSGNIDERMQFMLNQKLNLDLLK